LLGFTAPSLRKDPSTKQPLVQVLPLQTCCEAHDEPALLVDQLVLLEVG
jgi:hypothetical protein